MNVDEQVAAAAALFNDGKYGEAAAVFNAIIKDPDVAHDAKAYMCHNVALCCESAGDIAGAIESYKSAVAWSLTQFAYLQSQQAQLLHRAGRNAEAAALLRDCSTIAYLSQGDKEAFAKAASAYKDLAKGKVPPAHAVSAPPASGRDAESTPKFREAPRAAL
jgi:tetratricopeptide (TPR) repeat protein